MGEELLGSTTSTSIGSSNIGFQLLKKHGWKEGTGLGVSEQGRLEPVQAYVKKNKRGLGADKEKKPIQLPSKNPSSNERNDKIFKSREALCKWTREVGNRNGFFIVIKTSDTGGNGRKAKVMFACERGGHYRDNSMNKEGKNAKRPRRETGTKKCGCPFALKGQKVDADDDWMLKAVCGVHNHSAMEHLGGHS